MNDDAMNVAVREEVLSRIPAESLSGVLGIPDPTQSGEGLPELWHWVYLLERRPEADLGPDGHPVVGIPAPPGPGRRRMFAGGRVHTLQPLQFDAAATRTSRVTGSVEKNGRSGPMTLVTVRHEITQDGDLRVVEEQDIVYREGGNEPLTVLEGPGAVADREAHLELVADERLLFRFSALTYNAHRIHYDLAWCREEGYDGLVVHGPLQALLMGELFRRNGRSLIGRVFSYRLVSPMVGTQTVHVTAAEDGLDAGAEVCTASGRVTATATLRDGSL